MAYDGSQQSGHNNPGRVHHRTYSWGHLKQQKWARLSILARPSPTPFLSTYSAKYLILCIERVVSKSPPPYSLMMTLPICVYS